jgi:broad specificity phosphatase PhoE
VSILVLIRHGKTQWNIDGRLTGRSDIGLSPEGEVELSGAKVPAAFAAADWHVSPLRRARQTAALLGHGDARVEQRLIEMDFGAFEGRTLAELRADPNIDMTALEDAGLDFLPPSGESPRMVRDRLAPFLAELADGGKTNIAVAHKSVIRAVMAWAYDWPMLGKPPVKLKSHALHVFHLSSAGHPTVKTMNQPFEKADEDLT